MLWLNFMVTDSPCGLVENHGCLAGNHETARIEFPFPEGTRHVPTNLEAASQIFQFNVVLENSLLLCSSRRLAQRPIVSLGS